MRFVISALAGGLFGAGLLVAGMTDTAKVQGFLDLFGAWDPTLAFVMGGAMLPMALAWIVLHRRGTARPVENGPVDRPLIAGSALFGAGWGLAGLCPGPAIAALSFGGGALWIFFAAMLAGMAGHSLWRSRLDNAAPAQ